METGRQLALRVAKEHPVAARIRAVGPTVRIRLACPCGWEVEPSSMHVTAMMAVRNLHHREVRREIRFGPVT